MYKKLIDKKASDEKKMYEQCTCEHAKIITRADSSEYELKRTFILEWFAVVKSCFKIY